MLAKIVHLIMPVVVVICATVLLAMRRIESSTALAMFSAAGVYGAGAAITAGNSRKP